MMELDISYNLAILPKQSVPASVKKRVEMQVEAEL
jgi:hypothetical protein